MPVFFRLENIQQSDECRLRVKKQFTLWLVKMAVVAREISVREQPQPAGQLG